MPSAIKYAKKSLLNYVNFICTQHTKNLLVGIKESPCHIILYQIANEWGLKIGDFENKTFTGQNLKGAQIFLRGKF